jgi:hypothetical protein
VSESGPDDDRAVCRRLAERLAMLQDQVESVIDDPTALADTRRELEAAAGERDRLLARWAAVPARLLALAAATERAQATSARLLAAHPGSLAVKVPPAFGVAPAVLLADVEAMRWTAARAHIASVLNPLDRAEASLSGIEQRLAELDG